MSIEYIIHAAAWTITVVCLFIFIPRDKIREAHIAFFFKQLLTWLFGLIVVEFRLIEYPVSLFTYATRASFTFEYFIYPAICAIFNVRFPENKSRTVRFTYYAAYTSGITLVEAILEQHTALIDYLNWSWYWSWLTLLITLYFSRLYYKWFFKLNKSGT